jgi:hypothetical protein
MAKRTVDIKLTISFIDYVYGSKWNPGNIIDKISRLSGPLSLRRI